MSIIDGGIFMFEKGKVKSGFAGTRRGDAPMYLIVGESGGGKNYFCERLGLVNVPSYTTRAMRPGEVNGREHVFVKTADWERLKRSSRFRKNVAAWTEFHGNFYWTLAADIEYPRYTAFIVDPRGVGDLLGYVSERRLSRDFYVIHVRCGALTRFRRMFVRDVLRAIDVGRIYAAHRKMEWCPPMSVLLTAFSIASKCLSGARKTLSRMTHDVSAFRGFASDYHVDYTIRG